MFENKIDEVEKLQKTILKFRPLSPHQVKQLKDYYRVSLTFTSNALEGNSLSEVETKVVLEDGLTIAGKPLREHLEATGHAKAYDKLYALSTGQCFTLDDIHEMHRLFYSQIDSENAGHYRSVAVLVSGFDVTFPGPSAITKLMQEFIDKCPALDCQHHPIEYAALVHNTFVSIHPYIDGNGRTARLLMNLILMQKGYPITIIPPIFRSDYLQCANQGNQGKHEAFINFLTCMVYESQKEYIRLLDELTKQ